MNKNRTWIYNATAKVSNNKLLDVVSLLKEIEIKLIYDTVVENELYTMQIFSNTPKESEMIKAILENYGIKYYAIETKEVNGN